MQFVIHPSMKKSIMRRQFEKPQTGNRHKLTVEQHIWPVASINRFVGSDRTVSLHDKIRRLSRQAKPQDPIFCAKRVWDQRAESGYMKGIEDAFQAVASQIEGGAVMTIDANQKETVDAFFALWKMRADYKSLPDRDILLKGVTGEKLTKDKEERFEKAGVGFFREGGNFPSRMHYGLQIQFRIDSYVRDLASVQWGIVRAQEGHFMVPDYPTHTLIPVSPMFCLCDGGQSGVISRENLAEINQSVRAASVEYFFAQDFSQCP